MIRGRRWWPLALAGAAATVAGGALARRERREFERQIDGLLADLDASARPDGRETTSPTARQGFDPGDLDDVPAPIRRYLRAVIDEGRPPVRRARLVQHGEDRSAAWKPFDAAHHVAVDPPGFVWDAEIELTPRLGFVPSLGVRVVDARTDPKLTEAELAHYLAESVWYPTTLLPGDGLRWESSRRWVGPRQPVRRRRDWRRR
jgi:hypothetical protein